MNGDELKIIEEKKAKEKIKNLEDRIEFLEDYISNQRLTIQELVSDMSEAVKISLNRAYADFESFMILVNEKIIKK